MDWRSMIVDPVQSAMDKLMIFIPNLVGVLVILLVGWMIAMLLRKAVNKLLVTIKIDTVTEKSGLKDFFEKGNIKGKLSGLVSNLVYWLVMLVVFVTAVNAFGLTVTSELLDKLVFYMPKVVASIFIIIFGLFFSTVLGSIVSTALANAEIKASAALGHVTKIVVIAFSILTAMEQLEISTRVIEMSIFVFLSSLGLGMAIAIGLGAKDHAGRFLEDMIKKMKG